MKFIVRTIIMSIAFGLLIGCASKQQKHPDDPFESANRGMYALNKGLDNLYIKPMIFTYKMMVPSPVRQGVGNVFQNISEIPTIVNSLLQWKPEYAGRSIIRFVINSTFGILGIFDVAKDFGIERHSESFANTLLAWGFKNSSYLVIPVLGPSTVRDAVGFAANGRVSPDYYLRPKWRNRYYVANYIHKRSELLELEEVVRSAAAVDEYAFVRDAYLQRRANFLESNDEVSAEDELFLGEPPE